MNSMRPVPNVLQTAVFVLFIMFCITVIDRLLGYAIQSDDIGLLLGALACCIITFCISCVSGNACIFVFYMHATCSPRVTFRGVIALTITNYLASYYVFLYIFLSRSPSK